MPSNTPADYYDVFQALEHQQIRYVVVSGMAVVLHGHTRPVFDLDILIAPTPEEQNRALQTLMLAGFISTVPLPLNLVTVMRMFDQQQREIDLFARYHIPFADLWADSVRIPVGETSTQVASFEHLIRAKRITNRPHDLEDLAGLLAIANPSVQRRGSRDGDS